MTTLRFAVPSIDRLIDPAVNFETRPGGFSVEIEPRVVCIVGPDGVGKSILALHMASAFHADALGNAAVLYVSTDLKFYQAKGTWERFGLNVPAQRGEVLSQHLGTVWQDPRMPDLQTDLLWATPTRSDDGGGAPGDESLSLNGLLADSNWSQKICFLDLATTSAGDDWTVVNRLAGMLINLPESTPRMLIVDAVEGLELNAGERDSFGYERNRRSRVAQLTRLAKRARCHLVLIVEQAVEGRRHPEEFVADLVIRLRSVSDHGYDRRTLEIEKARGHSPTRGQHDLAIRSGAGTRSDMRQVNFDDPNTKLQKTTLPNEGQMSYLFVFPSLHARDREFAARLEHQPKVHHAGTHEPLFGIRHLDELVQTRSPKDRPPSGSSPAPSGSLSALTGDPGTLKSPLGRAFLSRAFRPEDLKHRAAILLTTQPVGKQDVIDQLKKWWVDDPHSPAAAINDADLDRRVIVRHIRPHFLTASELFHIVDTAIRQARLVSLYGDSTLEEQRKESWRIRLVFDDWNALLKAHPNLANESLLLPSFEQLLRCEGVTALMIGTQPGAPLTQIRTVGPQDLRNLDARHVYTWPVPFFGHRRVAISTFPPVSPTQPPWIYELKPIESEKDGNSDDEVLKVDRHFALYAGLEEGRPNRIPAELRLYAGYHAVPNASHTPEFVRQVTELFSQVFSTEPIGEQHVRFEPIERYNDFWAFVRLVGDTKLDHTLIMQIDEFWSLNESSSLSDLSDYWSAITARVSRQASQTVVEKDADNDPNGLFQPFNAQQEEWSRKSFFIRSDPAIEGGAAEKGDAARRLIPYHWDFGFLLARRDRWWDARARGLPGAGDRKAIEGDGTLIDVGWQVGSVWNALAPPCCRFGRADGKFAPLNASDVTWELFFAACKAVKGELPYPAFDVDLRTTETLSSLVLEMWWSEIDRWVAPGWRKVMVHPSKPGRYQDLRAWIQTAGIFLHMALERLLDTSIPLKIEGHQVGLRSADPEAIAARHWYATASSAMLQNRHLVPIALPGRFSTRGDWYLASAAGSRSELVAHRVIDQLISRRMNIYRLHGGMGLPVRDVIEAKQYWNLRTALSHGDPHVDEPNPISMFDLMSLGDWENIPTVEQSNSFRDAAQARNLRIDKPHLNWLWRSLISDYDRHAFYFYRWLGRVIQFTKEWRMDLARVLYTKFAEDLKGQPIQGWQAKFALLIKEREKDAGWLAFKQHCDVLEALFRDPTQPGNMR